MGGQGLKLVGGALIAVAILLGGLYAAHRPAPGRLTFVIETKPAVMSGAYKVYASRTAGNGRYWISKVVIKNEGTSPIEDTTVSFQIPGLVSWTTPKAYPRILPGQTVVSLFYPRLPDSLALKTTTTTEQVELRVEYADRAGRKQQTRQMDFQLRGRNDMMYTTLPAAELVDIHDYYENTDLFAAFVTPDDPVIKYFVEQLEQKAMGGTTVGAGSDGKEITRFLATVFAFEQASGIVYAGTPGLVEKSGSTVTTVQHMRLPREVLLGGAGLCVELAALYASISEAAGLDPVIFTTASHAFPGVRVNGQLFGFESTMVGAPGLNPKRASFDEAFTQGQKESTLWLEGRDAGTGPPIRLLDMAYLHHAGGIVPPELPDDPAARQKIDEIFARLLGSRTAQAQAGPPAAPAQRTAQRTARTTPPAAPSPSPSSPPAGGANRYTDSHGFFSVALPTAWNVTPYPAPRFQSLALSAQAPDQSMGLQVYVFPGVQGAEVAIGQIRSMVASNGGQMTFQERNGVNIGERPYRHFVGSTVYRQGGSLEWEAFVRSAGGGTVILTLGAKQGQLTSALPILREVAGTFNPRA